MPSFLKDLTPFYGTGEKNAEGKTLEQFLEDYDPYRYRTPCCTTDAVVFSYSGQSVSEDTAFKVLLVKRKNHPSIGFWALPGGFIHLEENLEDTARRELEEETGVKGLTVEQFACYGDWNRDPRARVITTAYMALTEESRVRVQAGDDAADAAWCTVHVDELFQKETEDYTETTYALKAENREKELSLCATVKRTETRGLIREKKYAVSDPGKIAVDHAAILVQAYLLLKERIAAAGRTKQASDGTENIFSD